MASSQHRPGAKVTLSPASYSKEKMKQVENLEAQLEQEKSKKSDEAASRLRMRLCEIISDVILTDPQFTVAHDCIGRLWRSCFYGPIGVLRTRLSKEKRKKGPNIVKLEKSLKHFLTEAITLYKYLISSYHGKLLPSQVDSSAVTPPNSQDTLSQNSLGDSQSQSQAVKPSTSPAGVVPGLYRMYIHMGDLYRYDSGYHKAQTYYNSAAKLSPGRGNPYNQLAVVAQLKDTAAPLNAVALFWYARSLLTTFEAFEISKANLARLFQSNRDWFHKQPPPPPDVLKPTTSVDGVNNGGREMVKSQRTVASRHFLSQFVDLHFSFFQGVKGTGGSEQQQDATATPKDASSTNTDNDVVQQMEAILVPLSVLLRASAFGDSLLCKMVVICAFSEAYNPHHEGQPKSQGMKETEILARVFTLAFGACLAERAAVGLKKIQDQPEKMGNPGKAPPSVRLLLPLLLVCEYIESRKIGVESRDLDGTSLSPRARAFCEKMVGMFWQRNIDVMNILTNLRGPLGLDNSNGGNWENSSLKEFHGLVGYSPFETFLDDPMASSREDGFASVEEAVDVLELTQTQNSQSQDSNTQLSLSLTQGSAASAGGSAQSVEEYKVKVARFLAFGDRMADKDDNTTIVGRRFERNSQGAYVWKNEIEDEIMEDNGGDDNPMMDEENMEDNNDTQPPSAAKGDEGGDVLVYSVPQGGGPALLVPGMLLQNRASSNAPADKEPERSVAAEGPVAGPPIPFGAPGMASPFPMSVDTPNPLQPAPAAPPAMMPPPGFGGAAAPTASTLPMHGVGAHAHAPQGMGGDLGIPGFAPLMGHGAGMSAGFHQGYGSDQGYGSAFPQQQQQQRFESTIGNSMHMFGGPEALKTGNPFAAASTPSIDAHGNMMLGPHMNGGGGIGSVNTGSFLNPGVTGAGAESSLLGSGLLSSLFEDAGDKTTNNPFST